jgi:hypothetical protein
LPLHNSFTSASASSTHSIPMNGSKHEQPQLRHLPPVAPMKRVSSKQPLTALKPLPTSTSTLASRKAVDDDLDIDTPDIADIEM